MACDCGMDGFRAQKMRSPECESGLNTDIQDGQKQKGPLNTNLKMTKEEVTKNRPVEFYQKKAFGQTFAYQVF